jgi:hypothetical protein
LIKFLQKPVLMYSFFSGKGTWATVMEWFKQFAKANGIDVDPQFHHVTACDIDVNSLHLLTNHRQISPDGRLCCTYKHVFRAIESFMTEKGRQIQEDMVRSSKSPDGKDNYDPYEMFKQYAYNNGEEMFGGVQAACLVCGKDCPVIEYIVRKNQTADEIAADAAADACWGEWLEEGILPDLPDLPVTSDDTPSSSLDKPHLDTQPNNMTRLFLSGDMDENPPLSEADQCDVKEECGQRTTLVPTPKQLPNDSQNAALDDQPNNMTGDTVPDTPGDSQAALDDEPAEMTGDPPASVIPVPKAKPVFSELVEVTDELRSRHAKPPPPPPTEEYMPPKLCDLDAWTWFDGSSPCIAWSGYGLQRGLADPSAIPFYTYCGLIRYHRPKLFTHEITSMKTAQLMKDELGDIYNVSAVEICCSMLGRPKRRPRMVAWGSEKSTVDNFGDADKLLDLIAHSIELTGNCFFVFDEERKDEPLHMARTQHNFVDREDVLSLPMEHLLAPGTFSCYQEHMGLKETYQGTDGSYIFDANQHPSHSKGSSLLPCLVTHGTIVSEDRIMTSSERMLAMGEPISKDDYQIQSDLKCYIGEALDSLSPTARKRMQIYVEDGSLRLFLYTHYLH